MTHVCSANTCNNLASTRLIVLDGQGTLPLFYCTECEGRDLNAYVLTREPISNNDKS